MPPEVEAWSLNYLATKEILSLSYYKCRFSAVGLKKKTTVGPGYQILWPQARACPSLISSFFICKRRGLTLQAIWKRCLAQFRVRTLTQPCEVGTLLNDRPHDG